MDIWRLGRRKRNGGRDWQEKLGRQMGRTDDMTDGHLTQAEKRLHERWTREMSHTEGQKRRTGQKCSGDDTERGIEEIERRDCGERIY